MNSRKLKSIGAALIALVVSAPYVAMAQGIGVPSGVQAGAPSGLQVTPGPNLNLGGPLIFPMRRAPQRFRDLNLAGRVGVDPAKLPPEAKIVRLRLDGRIIPMRLDTELASAELQFEPDSNYGRELYRAILTKQVAVVGAAPLRDALQAAADKSAQAEVEGYVFNLTSPYLVLKAVKQQQ